ncbi:MAG: hypothetical protein KGL39_05010 [Patescibacteria group bacterium]|nr:hypothetical protein [Patescibacteria group bacterium]
MNSLGFRVEGAQLEFTVSATSRSSFEEHVRTIRLVAATVWPEAEKQAEPTDEPIISSQTQIVDLRRDPARIEFMERMGLA